MQNPYVQVSVGLVLVGLSLVVFAFFAAVAMAIVDGIKRGRMKNKIERAQLQYELNRQRLEDDLK